MKNKLILLTASIIDFDTDEDEIIKSKLKEITKDYIFNYSISSDRTVDDDAGYLANEMKNQLKK